MAVAERVPYGEFIASKRLVDAPSGIDCQADEVNERLFPFQREITAWAIRRGRAAIFAHTGLGKTGMQLVFAERIAREMDAPVLILAPLAVSAQTVREGEKFGVPVTRCRDIGDIRDGVNVTNYERLDRFDPDGLAGIVCDEASLLKAYDGIVRAALTEFAAAIPYRLCCSATPAPNEFIELGAQAEFLGVMSQREMLALYFTQDGNTSQRFRLKGHGRDPFWDWVATWAVACRKPSDLGYSDEGYDLPPLRMIPEVYEVDTVDEGISLFPVEALTLQERRAARASTLAERVGIALRIVNESHGVADKLPACPKIQTTLNEPWILWCGLNAEQDALAKAFGSRAISVYGSLTADEKERRVLAWLNGDAPVLLTKPSVCGMGMNFQHCARMVFVGLSDSFEQMFQAIRRCWRFGQTREVHCHVVTASTEGAVVRNIERKERQWETMMDETVSRVAPHALGRQARDVQAHEYDDAEGDGWRLMLGDSTERIPGVVRTGPLRGQALPGALADESVGLTVFSPPFPGMWVYTNSPHDMGNVRDTEEMIEQYRYLIPELLRVTMPGRSCCVHLTQGVAQKVRDGYIGIRDFRGKVIEAMEDEGWIYYGEVCIDKNPQVKAVRTKDRGLLFKSLATDSANMHMALADYLLQFRKRGDNPAPIRAGISEKYANPGGWITSEEWIEWAAPVWYRQTEGYAGGIRETNVLNVSAAREEKDERHLCPIQLDVVERAVKLWSAPGDLVLDPFNGIGSTGVVALRLGRRYCGVELKRSYWDQSRRNLAVAKPQTSLLDLVP